MYVETMLYMYISEFVVYVRRINVVYVRRHNVVYARIHTHMHPQKPHTQGNRPFVTPPEQVIDQGLSNMLAYLSTKLTDAHSARDKLWKQLEERHVSVPELFNVIDVHGRKQVDRYVRTLRVRVMSSILRFPRLWALALLRNTLALRGQ
jgi:hypothetical protein